MRKLYLHTVSASLILVVLAIYLLLPFYLVTFDEKQGFYIAKGIHQSVLKVAALFYIFYQAFLIERATKETKLERFLKGVRNGKLEKGDWKNIRYTLVKFFFIPLMLPSAIIYLDLLIELSRSKWSYTGIVPFFNQTIFTFIIYSVSFVTLGYYAFGYLFESKKLNSEVKSVDDTVLGWGVLLICYTPFFVFMTKYVPFPTQDYAFFVNQEVTFVVRIVLSIVMLFKLSVVMRLGAKCSNLTNRGIVTSGAYRYIRHPHYLAKLIVWWVTFLPYLVGHLWAIGPMLFWTVIYFLRAVTEERHLSKDQEYIDYKKKVKWMFIPYVV
ncbi:MAG: DUF1295 domain-containing protein [Flavobacteriales bacterium]|nr:DUF1295 domain-containing protein [Flavobacteriales bacterium]